MIEHLLAYLILALRIGVVSFCASRIIGIIITMIMSGLAVVRSHGPARWDGSSQVRAMTFLMFVAGLAVFL